MIKSKQWLGEEIRRLAKSGGWTGPVNQGLMDGSVRSAVKSGADFLFVDHSYFRRGWDKGHFRLTRKWFHLTSIKPRPDDRMKRFGVEVHPWRKTGRKVVVIPNTPYQQSALGGANWVEKTVARLQEVTERPVEIREKDHKIPLPAYLEDVWAVVTWGSVAGVEAALLGVPVFAEPTCAAYPVSAGTLENIDTPHYAENRHEWACSLAYASWHISEAPKIRYADYDYSLRDDLP